MTAPMQLELFDTEHWRPVVGYEGLYEVSDQGKVRSLERTVMLPTRWGGVVDRRVREQILKTNRHTAGYPWVTLCRDGAKRRMFVHRLVLETFVGTAPDGMQACHYNDVPDDNRLANLRWDTASANGLDKVRNGGCHQSRKTHCPSGHAYSAENTERKAGGGRRCRSCHRDRERRRRLAAGNARAAA